MLTISFSNLAMQRPDVLNLPFLISDKVRYRPRFGFSFIYSYMDTRVIMKTNFSFFFFSNFKILSLVGLYFLNFLSPPLICLVLTLLPLFFSARRTGTLFLRMSDRPWPYECLVACSLARQGFSLVAFYLTL